MIVIILGRPFLATRKALIYVQKGELVLRLNDESMLSNFFHSYIKYRNDTSDCFRIDVTDELFEYDVEDLICEDPLDICLIHSCSRELGNKDLEKYVHYLEAGKPLSRMVNYMIEELGHVARALIHLLKNP